MVNLSRINQSEEEIIHLLKVYNDFYQNRDYDKALKIILEAKDMLSKTFDKMDPLYAITMDHLGLLYYEIGNYSEAEKYYLEAKEIYGQVLGHNHPNYARSLNHLGSVYSKLGNYTEAEKYYLEAQGIIGQVLGHNHPDYATSLNSLGLLYSKLGNYTEAEKYYLEAKEIGRQVLGQNHPNYAMTLNELGLVYYYMSNYSEAEKYYLEAKEIYGQVLGHNHRNYAMILNGLGQMYCDINNYPEAEKYYLEAKEIFGQVLGHNHPDYAMILNNLGLLYYYMDNYPESEKYYLEAKEIYGQTLGHNHPDYAMTLNNLGLLYSTMDNYPESEKYYLEANNIRKGVYNHNHPDYATTLDNLGILHYHKDNYAESEKYYLEAKNIRGQTLGHNHPDYARSLINLGVFYITTVQFKKGLKLFEESSKIFTNMIEQVLSFGSENERMIFLQSIHFQLDLIISTYLHIYRNSTYELDSRRENLEFVSNLIVSRKGIGLEALQMERNISQLIKSYNKYSNVKQKMEEYKDVRKNLSKIIESGSPEKYYKDIKELTQRREKLEKEVTRLISEIRRKEEEEENIKSSKLDFKDINIDIIRDLMPKDSIIVEYVRYKKYYFDGSNRTYSSYAALIIPSLFSSSPIQHNFENINFVDLGDAKIIEDSIREFKNLITKNVDRRSSEKIRNLIPIAIPNRYNNYDNSNKEKLDTEGNHLRSLIFDPLIPYFGRTKRLFIAPDGVLSILPFEILPFDDDKLKNIKTDKINNNNSIEQYLIDKYFISYLGTARDITSITNIDNDYDEDGNKKIVNGKPIVIADPDYDYDSLHTEPLIANVEKEITIIPKSEDVKRTIQNHYFNQLPGTEQEGRNIAKILNVTPWLGKDARESRLKQELTYKGNSPIILHIATHGFFLDIPEENYFGSNNNNKNRSGNKNIFNFMFNSNIMRDVVTSSPTPLSSLLSSEHKITRTTTEKQQYDNSPLINSGLALAGANIWFNKKIYPDEKENGILTAEDVITDLNLSNTELVVLSACQTGEGKIVNGEGVFGLRRAFVLAGAQTLVMSLWKVSDKHTQELMEIFYRNLKGNNVFIDKENNVNIMANNISYNGNIKNERKKTQTSIGRAQALREAQLAIKEKYPNPYYWGAFICQGNPGNMVSIE